MSTVQCDWQSNILTVSKENRNLELDTTKIPRISQAAGQLDDHNIIQLLAGAWRRQFNALRTDFERVLNSAQSGTYQRYRWRFEF